MAVSGSSKHMKPISINLSHMSAKKPAVRLGHVQSIRKIPKHQNEHGQIGPQLADIERNLSRERFLAQKKIPVEAGYISKTKAIGSL